MNLKGCENDIQNRNIKTLQHTWDDKHSQHFPLGHANGGDPGTTLENYSDRWMRLFLAT
jgi:hypothetical protein